MRHAHIILLVILSLFLAAKGRAITYGNDTFGEGCFGECSPDPTPPPSNGGGGGGGSSGGGGTLSPREAGEPCVSTSQCQGELVCSGTVCRLPFRIVDLAYPASLVSGQTATITYTIINNVNDTITVDVRMNSSTSNTSTSTESDAVDLYLPTHTLNTTIDVPENASGTWTLLLDATYKQYTQHLSGSLNITAAQAASLSPFPDAVSSEAVRDAPGGGESRHWRDAWWLFLLLALVVGMLMLVVHTKANTQKTKDTPKQGKPAQSKGGKAMAKILARHGLRVSAVNLITDDDDQAGYALFKELASVTPALGVVRTNPKTLVRHKNTRYLWLTDKEGEHRINASDIEEVYGNIKDFLSSHQGGAILIQGVDYLISGTNYTTLLRILRKLKDDVSAARNVIIIGFNPDTLKKEEYAKLESEFTIVHHSKT